MDIDKVFQDQLIKITQEAAISVYPHLGKNNKIIADEAATNSMRTNLNKMNINLGEKIKKINSSEKKVLIKMLENPGKTYSREEIGKISGISQERSIDVMITRLRQKIEINPKNPKYLQTIRGSGYVLWIE